MEFLLYQVSFIRQNSVDAFNAATDDFDGLKFTVISHEKAEMTEPK